MWVKGANGRIEVLPKWQEAAGTPSQAQHLPQNQNLTSIISKMLSGSRLPFPTFLIHVTTPWLVTDTSTLAKEQASS